MPLIRIITDVFGVMTISLVSLTAVLGLLCIYRTLYFQLRVRKQGSPQLSYFAGPWIIRIALILVTFCWGFGEILRISFLRGRIKLFPSHAWQMDVCKFYALLNPGLAEPCIFLMLAFLLHASLKKTEPGTMGQRWNWRTVGFVLLFCLPLFIMQLVLVLVGPKLNNNEENDAKKRKMVKFFTRTSFSAEGNTVCTYPLMSTIVLGVFYALLISYVSYVGAQLLSLVINKGLQRRVYLLVLSVILFLPLRVFLLALSVLPRPGSLVYEVTVFWSFLMLLFCAVVGIWILVYLPVEDSLILGDLRLIEVEEMPYDDYYSEGASLVANQSLFETRRNSDASTKQGSISFRTVIKEEPAV